MLSPAVFGITNSGLNVAVDLVILFLVVIWLALVYWTYADARRRIADPMLIGSATVAALFPFVGTIVYMIVRPPEYLDDVRERELEMQAAEARLAELGYHLCPHCNFEVEKDFLRCPNCLRKLKNPCQTCGKPLDPMWKICPFCEAEIGGTAARRPRRRRETSEQPVAGSAGMAGERSSAGMAGDHGSSPARVGGGAADGERSSPAAPVGGGAAAPAERGGPSSA
jgi:hypothetical protein